MKRRNRVFNCLAAAAAVLSVAAARPAEAAHMRPMEIRVVVVTTWEATKDGADAGGELFAWRERWPLNVAVPFPVGEHALQYDPHTHVLAILTGMATARASASIMALGLDPRFDLSHAYWVVAGTAGVDPAHASIGSAAWARYVVDGDLAQEIDPRDMPADWSTGVIPYERTAPYQAPPPPSHMPDGNIAYALNPGLTDWAFDKTRSLTLPDSQILKDMRSPYSGPGAKPPFVLEGDALMSARFWYGAHLNAWASRWVPYWTGDKGVFVMSAEEDTGIMQALSFLSRAGRARLDRVLILRAGSDYTVAPPQMSAADFMAMELKSDFPATPAALDSLYRVASPIVRALSDNWAVTRNKTPGAPCRSGQACGRE